MLRISWCMVRHGACCVLCAVCCSGVDHQSWRGDGSFEGQEVAEGWPLRGPSAVHVRPVRPVRPLNHSALRRGHQCDVQNYYELFR